MGASQQVLVGFTGQTFITATGGTITTSGIYKIHTFTSGGNFVVNSIPTGRTIDYLVIAGGAGGGVGDASAARAAAVMGAGGAGGA